MRLLVRPRREVDALRASGTAAIARGQRPQSVDADRRTLSVEQLPLERMGGQIVDVDTAVAEVANQEVSGEFSERRWSDGEPPRRVQGSIRGEPADEISGEVEHVHEAVSRSRNFILLRCVLQSISHVQQATQIGDAERRITCRKRGIGESAREVGPTRIAFLRFDDAFVEVGRVEIGVPADNAEGRALVNIFDIGAERVSATVPSDSATRTRYSVDVPVPLFATQNGEVGE